MYNSTIGYCVCVCVFGPPPFKRQLRQNLRLCAARIQSHTHKKRPLRTEYLFIREINEFNSKCFGVVSLLEFPYSTLGSDQWMTAFRIWCSVVSIHNAFCTLTWGRHYTERINDVNCAFQHNSNYWRHTSMSTYTSMCVTNLPKMIFENYACAAVASAHRSRHPAVHERTHTHTHRYLTFSFA